MKKIFITFIFIFLLTSICYAEDYSNIYNTLKDDYPNLVNRMLNNGVTENQIHNLLEDLSNEVEKTDNLNEDNFNRVMYTSLNKVIFHEGTLVMKLEHEDFGWMLYDGFIDEINEALETKTLSGDLQGLSDTVKNYILYGANTPIVGGALAGGGSTTENSDAEMKITIDAANLNLSVSTTSGQVRVVLSQSNLMQSIEDQITDKTTEKVTAILDLKLNKKEDSQKITLPSLLQVFEKVNVLSIVTDKGTIILEDKFLPPEVIGKNIEFSISKSNNLFEIELNNSEGKITKFLKPIIVALPYNLNSGQNDDQITVIHIDENGNEKLMGGVYKDGKIEFYTDHFSKFKIVSIYKTFSDIQDIPWAYNKINALAAKGIINGRDENTFDPNAYITRAEFTALVMRSMKLSGNSNTLLFSDVPSNVWYRDYVVAAYENNIIKGRSGNIFDPDSRVTVEEAMITLSRIMNAKGYKSIEYENAGTSISDNYISSWAKDEIGIALYNNLQKDMPELIPNQYATRGQTANIVYEFYKKVLGENSN